MKFTKGEEEYIKEFNLENVCIGLTLDIQKYNEPSNPWEELFENLDDEWLLETINQGNLENICIGLTLDIQKYNEQSNQLYSKLN